MHDSQRLRHILALGLPIIGGMLSQSLINLVDAAMVGPLGATALAGVGIGSYANFVAIALVMGLGASVQAMVARRHGEGRIQEAAIPLNAGLLVAVLCGVPIALIGSIAAPQIVSWLSEDPAVQAIARDYFTWRVLAVAAVGLSFAFRGYWNGSHNPGPYLRILLGMHALNVLLSYGLIHGRLGLPALGAAGAGLGTCLALYAGALVYLWQTWRSGRSRGFLKAWPDRFTLQTLLRLSLPNSLQQVLFACGVALLFRIIGQIGSAELAVAHVLINLALLLILPGVGLGMAATTLVGHSLGAGQIEQAWRWGWDVVKVASVVLVLLGAPFWLMPGWILGLFVSDPTLIALGLWPLRLTGVAMVLDAAALVFSQALLGAGASRSVMVVTLGVQWLVLLPLAWLIGPVLGHGLLAIWTLYMLQRGLSSALFIGLWQRRQWARLSL
ncbi:MATE family efflux transporter [Pseudomonas sp. NW5]|uniref:MATE family efflux transporter n=1 Tax=Pseudomonas sp. NW5 TaxID=2934934 RepID=UPI002021DA62|nr:MATE family efflux transporter [Pseudomonas sp. NW5]MCL7463169.1 MATE family efflux transporter [Pseudomonas sp. NW5]